MLRGTSKMQQMQIHKFLERYFLANNCEILDQSPGHLEVQLTAELDKMLMNRPFYWHYLEKTGGVPQPMKMAIITNKEQAPDHINGEQIHFGSPRLHQIFQSTKELGGFIRLYEKPDQLAPIALHPWICLNIKISFQCDRKKDMILSLGLNLIHGQIVAHFFDELKKKQLTPKIPDYCFTLTPLITPKSGLIRLEKVIIQFIEQQDSTWADEAKKRWEADLALLNRFYEGIEEKPESYEIEKEALKSQYEPKVVVSVINGGMFYLQHPLTIH